MMPFVDDSDMIHSYCLLKGVWWFIEARGDKPGTWRCVNGDDSKIIHEDEMEEVV